jgi:uncharacterized protein (DUF3820 family)
MGDTDKMPFGKFKGTCMANVPDGYLLDLWEEKVEEYVNGTLSPDEVRVMDYIQDFGVENLKR